MIIKKTFQESFDNIYNPYIGFTSFQHFRDEALYSDCITGRRGTAGIETENYECYPVPDGVEQNGREQGYYPDTTVAYIRVLWKVFEPEQGKYNYQFIEEILNKAKEKRQTVMFRLMPHSTCARDDVPDWLKKIIPCPERPDGKRVKDSPTDPLYLKLFGNAIKELGKKFDKHTTLDCIDVSIGGAWGEGSQDFNQSDMYALMDIYIDYFPNTKLIGQFSNIDMLNYIGKHRSIGWRADGTGEPKHMYEEFPNTFPLIKSDLWETAPVSFESYWWISEWKRQGWDLDYIINRTLEYHISTFNTKSFPIPFEWKEKIDDWIKRMGYRFYLSEIEYSESCGSRKELSLKLKILNRGVAPIYNLLPFRVRLKGAKTYQFHTKIDITKWLPGENNEQVDITIPKDVDNGKYFLQIMIGGQEFPIIKLASKIQLDEEYYNLAEVYIK